MLKKLDQRIFDLEARIADALFAADFVEADALAKRHKHEPYVVSLAPLRYELAYLRERRLSLTEKPNG